MIKKNHPISKINKEIWDEFTNNPTGIFDKLVEMGYDVHARYLDEGWTYIGMYDNGEVTRFINIEDVIKECPELYEEFDIRGMIEETIV